MAESPKKLGKICSVCVTWKKFASFYKHSPSHDGLRSACKPCYSAQQSRSRIRRKRLKDSGAGTYSEDLLAKSLDAYSRHIKDFKHRLEHTAPTQRLNADFVCKNGIYFYKTGVSLEGQEMAKVMTRTREYYFNLGLNNPTDIIVQFLWKRGIVVVYPVPELEKEGK